jgi:hypothetical protein
MKPNTDSKATYRRRKAMMDKANKVAVLFYLDKNLHKRLITRLPRGRMTAFAQAAITLALTPQFFDDVKGKVTKSKAAA